MASLSLGPALARDGAIPAVEAVGSARELREPDRAIITLAIEAVAPTSEQATRELGVKVTRATALLASAGIDDADTESDGLNVEAVYETTRDERGREVTERRRLTGHKAVYALTVTLLRVAEAPALLPRLAEAGGLIRSVDFTLSDRAARILALEERAVKEAVERARRLIAAAGAKPGRVLSITPQDDDGLARRPSRPVMARMAAPEAEPAAIPVRPGRIVLTARVAVAIEIVAP